jgi:predicted ATPase
VLFLDDLHAADAPSLLLLRFLARELGSTRILLLGAYRDVDPVPGQHLTDTLAEVARERRTTRLALGGLSDREVAQYVELTASEIASSALVAELHAETEGNPLFVGEMVRLLSIEGVPSTSAAGALLAIPQSIRDVIARRLSHLSAACVRTLVIASVVGREFALDTVARMGDISESELLDVLDEAQNARVISDPPGGMGRLRFAHVLIRDTLYEGLTSARRIRLHRLAVEALEALYGDEPGPHLAELAYHSVAGRDLDRGLRYAWRAGDRALALLAYEEAARLYGMALEALELADRWTSRRAASFCSPSAKRRCAPENTHRRRAPSSAPPRSPGVLAWVASLRARRPATAVASCGHGRPATGSSCRCWRKASRRLPRRTSSSGPGSWLAWRAHFATSPGALAATS